MPDPVQEAIAELVFADQLVDVDELETIAADAWLTAYQQQQQLDSTAFTTRLMTAHDDPAVDEPALQQLQAVDREALLCLLTDLAAIDDHHDPRELAVLSRLAMALRLQQPQLQERLAEARIRTAALRMRLNKPLPRPRKRVRLLRRADQLVGQLRVDSWAARLAQQTRVRRWRRETFFNHRAYSGSLDRMHQLTKELMPQTQDVLLDTTATLETLQEQFKTITTGLLVGELPKESQEQLTSLLNGVRERLGRLVQEDLEELRKDLLAKKRSLHRFCMAAVGRTKAGKSTLIATLTGRDQGAIGDGRQGFTRYNRAYNFCGIRLIDTPGIGAAGGQGQSSEQAEQRDSNVARSIFPESDLVCFVIDSDSTVPCTRELMQQLHQRGKAFLILLNVKVGLQGGFDLLRRRLEAKFAPHGEQSISGNIASIRRDLSKALGVHAAEAIPIIPIHAKAAFKAAQLTDPREAEDWRELSRIDLFLEQLDQLITEQAKDLRRQTLRANPRRELERIIEDLGLLEADLGTQARIFGETEERATQQVQEIFAGLRSEVRNRLQELFGSLETCATIFANDTYRRSGPEIERRWKEELERFDLTGQINELATWLKAELTAKLEALQSTILEQLQFQVGTVGMQSRFDFQFDIGFEEFMRQNVNIGSKVIAVIFTVLMTFPNPIQPFAWAGALLSGFAPQLVDWLVPGADKRRREAQNALKSQLLDSLVEPRAQVAQQFDDALKQQQEAVAQAISQGLNSNRLVLLAFREQLLAAQGTLRSHANALA
jgi:GTP-binding protein EngB required for normal cell division